MDALSEAIDGGRGFPAGLFWIRPAEGVVFSRVNQLMEEAKACGIQAQFVEAETFDELMGDLLVLE